MELTPNKILQSDKRFQLQRYSDDSFSTLGILHEIILPEKKPYFWAYTLEDEYREKKVARETRIPAGDYEIKFMKELTPLTQKYRSDRRFKDFFYWHLWLPDVNNFNGVYIHVGNTDEDTEACILLGNAVNNNQYLTSNDGRITESVIAYTRFYKHLAPHLTHGGRVLLRIKDENQLAI